MKAISPRKRRKRKLVLFIIEIVILLILGAGFYIQQKLDKIQTTDLDQSKIEKNDVSKETEAAFKGYTTIALFGLDNRTQGVYKQGNSDVIMIMSINNDTQEVKMVSVYRDTYLNISSTGQLFRKANAAYANGGAEEAESMLNKNLDLDIDNYVSFDFGAVAEAIDILGGVKINIDSSIELHYVNEYITYTNKILGTNASHISGTGTHTLNGVQAVAYSRVRYTAGGDFKRAQRQRRVLSQMIKKAKKANLLELNKLIDTVFPDIKTDLTKSEMLKMMNAMLGYDMSSSSGFPFYRTTATLSTVGSIVIPCDLEKNVSKLHKLLYGNDGYEPSSAVQTYNSIIINNTGKTKDDAIEDEFTKKDDFESSSSSSSSSSN